MNRAAFLALLARLRGDGEPLNADEVGQVAAYVGEHAGEADALTDAEVGEVETLVVTLADDDDVPLDALEAAVGLADAARTTAAARFTAAEEENQRRDDLRQRLAGDPTSDTEGDTDGDTGGDDTDGENDDTADTEADTGDGDTGDTGDTAGEGAGDASEGAGEQEPVGATAAGTPNRAARRAPGQLRNRRPSGQLADRARGRVRNRIVRDGGGEFDDLASLGEAMLARRESYLSGSRYGAEQDVVASILAEYPEERQLEADNPSRNQARLSAVTAALHDADPAEFEALTAAGGLCAPLMPYYGLMRLAEADRPFAAGLERFQAPRGGFIYRTPPDFPAFDAAVGQWTLADDEAALTDDDVRKPCLRVPCSETEEAYIYAVTECLTFGNFLARTDEETTRNAVENTMAAFARKAETLLIDAVKAGSKAVTGGQALGAFRDLVYHWTVAAVGYRSRHRMRANAVLEIRIPAWTWDMMRMDLMRSLPGDGTLTAAEAIMNQALTAANLRIAARYIDSPTTGAAQVFGTQGEGQALLDFPDTVQWQISSPGTWVMMDNGRLDLGTVRDADLVKSNDYMTFAETFEGVANIGLESLWVTSTVCPNGASSGTVDPADFCSGVYVPA